jgi:hypothetical protein
MSNPPEMPTIHFLPIEDLAKATSGFGRRMVEATEAMLMEDVIYKIS